MRVLLLLFTIVAWQLCSFLATQQPPLNSFRGVRNPQPAVIGENPVDESVLSENKALIRRLFEEEINQKKMTVMESMVADGYVSHNDSVGPSSDINQTEKFLGAVFDAFPDTHVTIEDMIAEGDKVVVRNTWRGTFQRPWMGIPPTGNEVTWTGIVIWKIKNGKITDRWANINFDEVLQKLACNRS